jgi:dihydrofolate reductase
MYAIAAIDQSRGIATEAGIPWDLPKDRAYFKRKTIGHPIAMGYKTYLTLNQPLSGRQNIVLTSRKQLRDSFVVCSSVAELLELRLKELWVIGGQDVYQALLPHVTKLYLTRVDADFGCTKFFPDFEQYFTRINKSKAYTDNGLRYWYEVWKRRS